MLTAAYLLLMKPSDRRKGRRPVAGAVEDLTEAEVDELCAEWRPEPLVQPCPAALRSRPVATPPILLGPPGPRVRARVAASGGGKGASPLATLPTRDVECLNLASSNGLGLAGSATARDACATVIDRFGCGACGPRGFYGTVDVHLTLERRLAKWLDCEDAILYSYDVATSTSVVPAFAKKQDVMLVSSSASWPVRQGCSLTRGRVIEYDCGGSASADGAGEDRGGKHAAALEAAMVAEEARRKKLRLPLTRRFVVVEGLCPDTGVWAPLAEVVRLARHHKWRVIVDDQARVSLSVALRPPFILFLHLHPSFFLSLSSPTRRPLVLRVRAAVARSSGQG